MAAFQNAALFFSSPQNSAGWYCFHLCVIMAKCGPGYSSYCELAGAVLSFPAGVYTMSVCEQISWTAQYSHNCARHSQTCVPLRSKWSWVRGWVKSKQGGWNQWDSPLALYSHASKWRRLQADLHSRVNQMNRSTDHLDWEYTTANSTPTELKTGPDFSGLFHNEHTAAAEWWAVFSFQ